MAAELVFGPEVVQDIDDAYGWYEGRRLGLGEEFLGSVEACLQGVCRAPTAQPKVHDTYRRALIRRFPFALYYELDGSTVTVYGVLHTARDPRKWRERLP